MTMKHWYCCPGDDDDYSLGPMQAESIDDAAYELGVDPEDVTMVPEWDGLDKITGKVFADSGWWQECCGCSVRITGYVWDDEDGEEYTAVLDSSDNLFCSQECLDAHARGKR